MSVQHETQTPEIFCFRCTSGCMHIVCFNVTLTLKRPEFLRLAEAVNAMQIELEQESREAASPGCTHPLLM